MLPLSRCYELLLPSCCTISKTFLISRSSLVLSTVYSAQPRTNCYLKPVFGTNEVNTRNYGGSIVTRNGLLFIGATNYDKKLRAFDKLNGKALWETLLPAAGNATPAMYEAGGRQFLVIAAGGRKMGSAFGRQLRRIRSARKD